MLNSVKYASVFGLGVGVGAGSVLNNPAQALTFAWLLFAASFVFIEIIKAMISRG